MTVFNEETLSLYRHHKDNPLVPMTLRIGVCGHRLLPTEGIQEKIEQELTKIYSSISVHFNACAESEDAKILYDSQSKPVIRLLSNLAEGADRLCLKPELIEFEHELAYILPFNHEEYSEDFLPGNSANQQVELLPEYYEHLSRVGYDPETKSFPPNAQVIELDGSRESDESRHESYLQAGRWLLEHSDIIIALYDGEGNSVTSTILDMAEEFFVPVIHVSTADGSSSIIPSKAFNKKNQPVEFNEDNISLALNRILLFEDIYEGPDYDTKEEEEKRRIEILSRFKRYDRGYILDYKDEIKPDFHYQGPIKIRTDYKVILGKLFSGFKETFGANIKSETISDHTPELEKNSVYRSSHQFYSAFLRADVLAEYYSSIHRSTFLLIYLLGAIAISLGAIGIKYPTLLVISAELFTLLLLFWFYYQDHKYDYHGRWLEYRSLAEFLRPVTYLSLLGKIYSAINLRDTKVYLNRELLGHHSLGRGWIMVYIETLIRHIGFSYISMTSEKKITTSNFIVNKWLNRQIEYHNKNARRMEKIIKSLNAWATFFFFLTLVIVLIKLFYALGWLSINKDIKFGLSLSVVILPVISSALFAVRNHAEFDISSQRSKTMEAYLVSAKKRFISQNNTTSVKMISENLHLIADRSCNEVAEWLEIYEVKESETA